MQYQRTYGCGTIRKNNVGEEVCLMGWVQRRRNHGKLIFIDLRDRSGIIQVVFDYEKNRKFFDMVQKLRSEYVIAVRGKVMLRSPDTVNLKLATGEIEIEAFEMEVLNTSKTPPFYIEDDVNVDENLRLKYRYLDLRRPCMLENLKLRHRVVKTVRDYLDGKGFLEVETPMLTRSTPEGARDYLVPSRLNPGCFFALPQSPQLFKQLLMVAGIERYFQIVRCFRDEDLRADRQPEFTQIDMEVSFCTIEDIFAIVEGLIADIFLRVMGVQLQTPFSRITYTEAMNRYGTDKPDLRFDLEIKDISDIAGECNFKVFQQVVAKGGVVKGINLKGCGTFSRKELDELTELARSRGAKGLAWIIREGDGWKSPIAKFFSESELNALKTCFGAENNDLLVFIADEWKTAVEVLGYIRLIFGRKLDLIQKDEYQLTWVTDFPLVEYSSDEKRYVANHHPFTAPVEEDIPLMETDPEKVRAQAYDLVLNGVEIGGGSIRIHRRDIQEKMFKLLGFRKREVEEKFGFLMEAFEYGAPPHGGIAFGLDRLVMLLCGAETIRDVIPFPKTASGQCLLTEAPAPVTEKQLKELYIRTVFENTDIRSSVKI